MRNCIKFVRAFAQYVFPSIPVRYGLASFETFACRNRDRRLQPVQTEVELRLL